MKKRAGMGGTSGAGGKLARQVARTSVVLIAGLVAGLTAFFALAVYPGQVQAARDFLKESNRSLNAYLDGYFRELVNGAAILARNPDALAAADDQEARARLLSLFADFQSINGNIYFVYAGYENGELAINGYEPPPGFDPRARPWYLAGAATGADSPVVAGILYEEIKTGESLLATVHALRDPDGSLKGVLAMDSYTVDLAAAIAERSGPYASANSYILGPDGTVLVHREKSFVGRHYSEFVPGIELPRAGDYIVYRFRGQDKIAYASVLDLNGWLIISTVDRRELSFPAIRGLIAYALILSILIVAFSALESRLRTRALVSPLLALHRRVACIASRRGGTEDALEDYPFPDNEIGELAAAIEQLASSALLEKNRELEAANDAIRSVNDELQAKNLLLQNLAVKDFLTGIYNRRKMEETLQEQFALLARYGRAFSVILIDLDRFKDVNDRFGHAEGDAVLKDASSLMAGALRRTDVLGRWGGEEFMVILTDTELLTAAEVAEKLRRLMESRRFPVPREVTVSCGVATPRAGEDPDAFMRRLDSALYRAKDQGRNRVAWE